MLKTKELKEWLLLCNKSEKVFVGDEKNATTYSAKQYGITDVKAEEGVVKVFYSADRNKTINAGKFLNALEGIDGDINIRLFEIDDLHGKEVNQLRGYSNMFTDITMLNF